MRNINLKNFSTRKAGNFQLRGELNWKGFLIKEKRRKKKPSPPTNVHSTGDPTSSRLGKIGN
jgi:hypothetical protein